MATTAKDVIRRTLLKLKVIGSLDPIPTTDGWDMVGLMNDIMAELARNGVSIGYTEVTSLTDTLTVPAGTVRAIYHKLTLEAAEEYDKNLKPSFAVTARESWQNLLNSTIELPVSEFGSTVPVGAGNQCDSIGLDNRFFSDSESELETEEGGSILLEDGTE